MGRVFATRWKLAGLVSVLLLMAAATDAHSLQAQTFSISGRVDSNGLGTGTAISGVTMTLLQAGTPITTQLTNADGQYSFTGVQGGSNYDVVPSKAGFQFHPVSRSYFNLSQNWTSQHYQGTVVSTVEFSSANYVATEGTDRSVLITVTRGGDVGPEVRVSYATFDGSASERKDYTAALGRLRFAPGETSKSFQVIITDDAFAEAAETFTVALSNGVGTSIGQQASATVTINSNDSTDGPSQVRETSFNSEFFVRQHYADFLGRVPDQGGLDFWSNLANNCNDPDLLVCRINVSAAFFLSIEFQESGYLVHRTHKVAFGNLPGKPVPLTIRDFLAGSSQIGDGVLVGVGNWEQQLEANKVAFFNEFITRSQFVSIYGTMNAAQYVDALNTNSGGALSAAEKNALVDDLSNNRKSAAQVLRAVAEDADFAQSERSRAFVLAQYFGYLRRDPDDTDFRGVPDPSFNGYNFWLSKLVQFNGNFIQAEMVKAFILSIEYQERFGR